MKGIEKLCKKVLFRLNNMGSEKDGVFFKENLIFPKKTENSGTKTLERVSEQEFRLLFIEEFKKSFPELHYSIETPTENKYRFGKSLEEIKPDCEQGRSASIDMCIHRWVSGQISKYERILNIEFKHNNASNDKIGKDILKLMYEGIDGAFIFLLDNTDSGSLSKSHSTVGLFTKLFELFSFFEKYWKEKENDIKQPHIQLIIISLKQNTIIYRDINIDDLSNLKHIFYYNEECGDITKISDEKGWYSI